MKTRFLTGYLPIVLMSLSILSCSSGVNSEPPGLQPGGDMPGGNVSDDTMSPVFDAVIYDYNGEMANDFDADIVGSDADFFYEANDFSTIVDVDFSDNTASVNNPSDKILCHVDGAHVVIDLLTNSVKNVNIRLSGYTSDGSLKIYGEKKFMLTLNGVDITSKSGPAINSQCKKRVFVHLADGTENILTDNATYTDDFYYPDGVTVKDEDRKGCFFSEGNMIFSGHGLLKVAGKQKHGIATDGYFWMRPGVTIAVTEAAKNAVHVKGDATDGIGVTINGGLLYTNVSSDAGKGIKTDMMVNINGGRLMLNTKGKSVYDADENDTSSPSCIKADGNITIAGGVLTLKSTGTGGKGISTDADLLITGGETTITTTGTKYYYNSTLTSSPKGVKADGNINITGGKLNISVTGVSDGSEGLESKANLTIDGGDIYIYAYDDAINAATSITINGGNIFAHAVNNDGIDSNGKLTVNGGFVVASGAGSPEESFDCDNSQNFTVTGGTLIGIAGGCTSPNTSTSKQNSLIYGGLSAAKDALLTILNSSGENVLSYKLHRSLTGYTLFASAPGMKNGTYTINADGSQIGSFTVANIVTTVGSNGGMGGNPGMGGAPGGDGPNTPPGEAGGGPGH